MPQYAMELFEHLTEHASEHDITLEVIHGFAPGSRGRRLGTGILPGARLINNRYVRAPGPNGALVWQPALRRCLAADLVVIEQANRLLINYVLLVAQALRGCRVAFWGHGRNLQAAHNTLSQRFKARIARAPWWWFAYTDGVAEHLASLGVPSSRTTVVGNTIDVIGLRQAVERQRGGTEPPPSSKCVFLGGLYDHKRLNVLFSAADLIAKRVPDFELWIAGDGERRADVERFVANRPWARYLGAVTGEARAELLASARLLLVPGLVGLVVLDSFAAGVPLVTTADALHSPEIEYLRDGVNGVVVPAGAGPEGYADVVTSVLENDLRWRSLHDAARREAEVHSVEAAAERFAVGLAAALEIGGLASSR